MNKLEELGIEENMMIMFLSDNGGCAEFLAEDGFVQNILWPMRNGEKVRAGNFSGVMPGAEDTFMSYDLPWANASNTPFRLFKHWIHEGGIATPFIVYWPSVIKGQEIVHEPTHVVDIMPTCVNVSGADYPEHLNEHEIHSMEGESLLPALRGENWVRQEPIFWEHEGNCAIRDGAWKMVKKHPGTWELYNMEQDRTEQEDLIGKDKKRADDMKKLYNTWAERCNILPIEELAKIAPIEDIPTFEEK